MSVKRTGRKPLRQGCSSCRARRTKCGKELPTGSQCTTTTTTTIAAHHIICEYTRAWPKTKNRPFSLPRPLPPIRRLSTNELATLTMPDDQYRAALYHVFTSQLDARDLNLITHWCNSTYRAVARDSNVESIWQTLVPQEAMRHPFLMRGLLAFAALDRANSASNEKTRTERIALAQRHQCQARTGLAAIRRSGEKNLDQSTCNAVFALSCVSIHYAIAHPLLAGPVQRGNTPIDDLCSVFNQTRDCVASISDVIDRVQEGELRGLIRQDERRPKMPDTSRFAILSLRGLNGNLAAGCLPHETDIYVSTIQHLSTALERLAAGGEPAIIAIRWIAHIPANFIELVQTRQPFALVVLAHFAVIIHPLRGHWWMGDWGMNVLHDIGKTLDGAEWRQHIAWVVDATGCHIPP